MDINTKHAALIFDRDGTLVRHDREREAALVQRCMVAAPQLSPAALATHWQDWRGPWPRTSADEPAFWVEFWASLAARYELTDAEQAELAAITLGYTNIFVAFPDTQPALAALRAQGWRFAALTNFKLPSVDQTLSNAGLDPAWFELAIAATTLGFRKPDPRAFCAVADALGLPPAHCVVVDDLPEHCAGARAAGMVSILLDRQGAYADSPLRRCASLMELPAMLTNMPDGGHSIERAV